ncbi:hypothetical protein ACO0LB_19825 [Undibacterium sp. SXout7W]|uniref:hypothetical protein n=1 Tax=Undibacterium sp. SXout7W TaxID=3413049 RepID=UPI003BF38992
MTTSPDLKVAYANFITLLCPGSLTSRSIDNNNLISKIADSVSLQLNSNENGSIAIDKNGNTEQTLSKIINTFQNQTRFGIFVRDVVINQAAQIDTTSSRLDFGSNAVGIDPTAQSDVSSEVIDQPSIVSTITRSGTIYKDFVIQMVLVFLKDSRFFIPHTSAIALK